MVDSWTVNANVSKPANGNDFHNELFGKQLTQHITAKPDKKYERGWLGEWKGALAATIKIAIFEWRIKKSSMLALNGKWIESGGEAHALRKKIDQISQQKNLL